ncbi:ankyrin repeat and KH domain-containing protein mask-like isoform X2 [Halichondria panicea]|uniref:ankyrin repeat and KH domain-containing protein mask-like isoform X2 n=1 Tax=Halichondria panicea TaxID=6063 RepID=UPI00312B4791
MSDNLARQLYWPRASVGGRDQEVLELLQRGAPPNSDYYTREQNGHTPLHNACARNHPHSAKLLIKFGAIVAATANDDWTSLHWACLNNSKDTAKLLLEHHCPTDIKNSSGRTAADMARQCMYLALANYLEGFQPGPIDPLSSYPTLEQLSQLECDQWLQLGARLGLGNYRQLETIKKSQHPTATTLQAAKVNSLDMHWKDIVEALVSIGEYKFGEYKLAESVCTQQGEGESALSVSAFYGRLDCVKHLVEIVGLNPKSTVNKPGDTPLSLACANGHLDTVKYLVNEHHCDPREPVNKAGNTPLSLACANGHLDTIKYLVNERHCDPRNTVNKAGDTLLSLACANGHLDIIKYLVNERHCDPRKPVNKAGDTLLSLACANGHLDTVKYLVNKHHCDPKSTVNKAGDTPLSLAYKGGHWEVVKYLAITHHCDTTSVLLLAVKHEQDLTVKRLLAECHSNPNLTDKEGKTPLDLANNPEIIKLLLKHGAKTANVYKKHSKLIGKLSSERPPHLPLSVLIIGDGGVGKSTLLKSIWSSKGFGPNSRRQNP